MADTPVNPASLSFPIYYYGYDLDDVKDSHGTFATEEVHYIAPKAKIHVIPYNKWGLVDVVDWVVEKGFRLVNISFRQLNLSDAELDRIMAKAEAAGLILVVAAGNEGSKGVQKPATHPFCICVGNMVNPVDGIFGGSGRGPEVWITAPGSNDMPNQSGRGEHTFTGTSSAAPIITGCLALYLQVYPQATTGQCKEFLKVNAVDIEEKGFDEKSGWGYFKFPNPREWVKVPENIAVFNIGSKEYDVNGIKKQMDVAPFLQNDRTFIPLRFFAEAMGATVEWDNAEQKITVRW